MGNECVREAGTSAGDEPRISLGFLAGNRESRKLGARGWRVAVAGLGQAPLELGPTAGYAKQFAP